MSWVGLQDTEDGIRVTAADAPEVDGEFVYTDVALLSRTVPHTIRFWIEVNPGLDNDLVRIAIDNRDVGQCFTTWENYYRTARGRYRHRTSIRQRTSTACSSAPACRGPPTLPPVVATCSTT